MAQLHLADEDVSVILVALERLDSTNPPSPARAMLVDRITEALRLSIDPVAHDRLMSILGLEPQENDK